MKSDIFLGLVVRKMSRFEETRRARWYRLIFSKRARWSRVIIFSNNKLQDESSSSTSQVRAKFESGSNFYFYFFSLLFISSHDCYSRNDVQVVNGKINFQVCNIFHHRSLEPFNTVVERYATSVHNFPRKIKTCSCIHLKQRYHFYD